MITYFSEKLKFLLSQTKFETFFIFQKRMLKLIISVLILINFSKSILTNKSSCCQLCDECENSSNETCCCDAETCHSVFIQCNTPDENTNWYISRHDTNGKRPSFIKITKNVFVDRRMRAELNITISTVAKAEKTQ